MEKRRFGARRPENRVQRLLELNTSRDIEQHTFLTHRGSERGELAVFSRNDCIHITVEDLCVFPHSSSPICEHHSLFL